MEIRNSGLVDGDVVEIADMAIRRPSVLGPHARVAGGDDCGEAGWAVVTAIATTNAKRHIALMNGEAIADLCSRSWPFVLERSATAPRSTRSRRRNHFQIECHIRRL